jgi:alkylation response protein AidB-like acyl-CoA dehydrogenase
MFGADEGELARGVRAFLGEQFDSPALHAFIDSGATRLPSLQAQADALGLSALALPERAGGLGVGLPGLIPVYAVLGAFMAPLPLLGTALAADLLDMAGADAWLARIAAGATSGVALPPLGDGLTIEAQAEGFVVTGDAAFLLDAADADFWLLAARLPSGPAWIACPSRAAGVGIETRRLVDETRHAARAALTEVRLPPDSLVAAGADFDRLEARLAMHAALAVAADSAGGAQALLEKTLEYLRIREQFSRPIGSFQALKHRAADLHLRLTTSQTLIEEAADAVAESRAEAEELALLAGAHAVEAYARIAEEAVQLHGGVGFTRDHDAHVHLKRAKLNQALLGGPTALRDRAARTNPTEGMIR